MYLLNVFHSGGAWVIPVVLFLAAFYTLYKGYKASKSGSKKQIFDKDGNYVRTEKSDINVPIYKTNQFKFFLILFAAAVVVLIAMASEYKGV